MFNICNQQLSWIKVIFNINEKSHILYSMQILYIKNLVKRWKNA